MPCPDPCPSAPGCGCGIRQRIQSSLAAAVPVDSMPLRIGSMCTGYGGLDMAVQEVFGGELAWVADPDPGAAAVLAHRYPDVPNLGDITDVRWQDVLRVDIVAAGFPCTDISYAGPGDGIQEGNRSGLWYPIAHALGVLRPRIVVLENVAGIVARRPGLDVVIGDLASLGFDAEWTCVRASDTRAPHGRPRWFLVARNADCLAWEATVPSHRGRGKVAAPRSVQRTVRSDRLSVPDADRRWDWRQYWPAIQRWEQITGRPVPAPREPAPAGGERLSAVFTEWLMGLPEGHVTAVPGISHDAQLRLLGNGVVRQQGAYALRILMDRIRQEVAA